MPFTLTLSPATPPHRLEGGRGRRELKPVSTETAATSRLAWGALFLIALVVPFYELGDFRTLGSHEAYAAVPAREMLDTGDWIVPRYGGLPRLQKPPLGYWLVAASGWVFGGVSEMSARVPAALAAIALAALMGVWAGRWYGKAAGYWAALVQLTSVWAIDFGRKAEVDMALCLLTTAAMWLIAGEVGGGVRRTPPLGAAPPEPLPSLSEGGAGGGCPIATLRCNPPPAPSLTGRGGTWPQRSFLRWTGIYALLAIAWLAKFHYAAAMVFASVAVFWAIERRWRDFSKWLNPAGLALVAAAAGIWPWLVRQRVPDALAVWEEETLGRAVGALDSHPAWFYLPHLVGMALPWSVLALVAIPRSWREAWQQADARERFLWVWLIVQNLILAAQANKHKHYLMACLPILSLWAARTLVVLAERARRSEPLVAPRAALAGMAACLGGSALAAALLARKWPYLAAPAIVVCAIAGAGGCAAFALLWARRNRDAALVACGLSLACYIGATGWIVPARDHRRPEADFARAVRASVPAERPVCVYGLGMSPVLFYVDGPVLRAEDADSLASHLESERSLAVVTRAPLLAELRAVGQPRVVRRFETQPDEAAPKEPPLVQVELTAGGQRPAVTPLPLREGQGVRSPVVAAVVRGILRACERIVATRPVGWAVPTKPRRGPCPYAGGHSPPYILSRTLTARAPTPLAPVPAR
ncbi:MAG: glycosyltransferase family 39 protein [Planctomycetales bacterium]